jgi:hypothetical protein
MELGAFASNTACQLDVLGHNGDTFGMNGAQIGVFKQSDQIGFAGFLQGANGGRLETQIGLEVLCNFTNQTLKWQFADQQFGRFLIPTNFTESDSTRTITMWFLDTAGGWSALTSGCKKNI